MSRPTYTVRASRSDRWWAIEGTDMPNGYGLFSQARRLDQVEAMARDAISVLLEVPEDSFDVHVDVDLPSAVDELVRDAKEARDRMAAVELEAREATQRAITQLAELGLPQRDVGQLLGMTHQRVAQIATSGQGRRGVPSKTRRRAAA